jgi:glucose-6-phosphate 1-dehydrogenase
MDPFALIIFGITSNLAQIKLIPALYDMEEKGILPDGMVIIGNARSPKSQEEIVQLFRDTLSKENKHHPHPIKEEVFERLSKKLKYIDGHLDDPAFYERLKNLLKSLESEGISTNNESQGTSFATQHDSKASFATQNKIFYLATYPELYHHIFENLKSSGLNSQDTGFARLMIEKPIGNDLASAKSLNHLLNEFFTEEQVYRLDHYLGKETLQNILSFRFANDVFEPMINKDNIDHIQITASEDYGIGKRGGYYDKVGALKDVGQNHQLQMIAFTTMDAPSEFNNQAVTLERIKILKALKPLGDKIVFGQYEGYKNEENVDPNSNTDTFYAFKTFIDNGRFRDVPIYVRAGKKLKQTVTEISIVFKNPPQKIFGSDSGDEPNILIYRIQPNEGIVLKTVVKKPGDKVKLEPAYMQYCYPQAPDTHILPDPYEKLLTDAIRGDQTFFNSAEEVETQWAFIDPLFASKKEVITYKEGTWGPEEADKLIESDGRKWLEPSMLFCRI